jgi:hypothetical protein
MTVRVFLVTTRIRFYPLIHIPPLLHTSNHAANTHSPVCISTASHAAMWLVTERVNYFACFIFNNLMISDISRFWLFSIFWWEMNTELTPWSRTVPEKLTLPDHTSDFIRLCDCWVLLQCRKMSDTVFVAFVRPLSEPIRSFSSCSTDHSQQIA